jgi:hypothetical protein
LIENREAPDAELRITHGRQCECNLVAMLQAARRSASRIRPLKLTTVKGKTLRTRISVDFLAPRHNAQKKIHAAAQV